MVLNWVLGLNELRRLTRACYDGHLTEPDAAHDFAQQNLGLRVACREYYFAMAMKRLTRSEYAHDALQLRRHWQR